MFDACPWQVVSTKAGSLASRHVLIAFAFSTTDHISAAGPWLKYKGHLSNIAENTRESSGRF